MDDSADSSERKLKASGGKVLSLKKTVESGHVRQNFSHGRSKSVVVEKKKTRTIKKAGDAVAAPEPEEEIAVTPEPAPAPAEKPAPVAEKPAAVTRKPTPAPRVSSERMRSGIVLRTLTEEEKNARANALDLARSREGQERKAAEDMAARHAEEDRQRLKARTDAASREAEEATRRETEEVARKRAAEEAKRRLTEEPRPAPRGAALLDDEVADDQDKPKRAHGAPGVPPKAPVRRVEPKRRTGKLTITKAFDDEGERQRSLASMRRRVEREKKKLAGIHEAPQKVVREVVIPEVITIQELANRMAERAVDVMKILMKQGIMLKITDVIDSDTAQLVAEELGHSVKRVAESDVEEGLVGLDDDADVQVHRAPVVTVMGHVDHGKTSLLDALRKTSVAAGEAGGITQHIGAYQVVMKQGAKITFLDTPGHAAFTAMRARGAKVTDIVVLVVAADDGVMPQTIEAINHAKAAGVPMIVAINKMDKPEADPARVKNELLQHEVVVEDFGGDTLAVPISAKTGEGLDKLEEIILLQAEILDLKANPNRAAEGIIVEAKLDRGRGPVGTVLVERGTLRVGDIIVAGTEWGRVRALINDRGQNVQSAGPSEPVEVLGLGGAPEAGDVMSVVETEGRAREVTDYRVRMQRDKRVGGGRTSLDQMLTQLKEQNRQEFPIVVKADVQGSAEAIVQALEKLGTDEVSARVLHVGVGGVTESDITLATASGAPVIGFNVRANNQARDAARQAGVEIRYYAVIYDLVDDIKAAMSGMLSPELRETFLGNAEILEVFNISKVGKVAGCRITEGVVRRGANVRLIRDNVVIHAGKLSTLKRFKDEVKEVQSGQECGMAFENYQDMRAGDVIECFEVEVVKRSLA
jgi:translation initiation factor IF-2